jgi:hypothetical protein
MEEAYGGILTGGGDKQEEEVSTAGTYVSLYNSAGVKSLAERNMDDAVSMFKRAEALCFPNNEDPMAPTPDPYAETPDITDVRMGYLGGGSTGLGGGLAGHGGEGGERDGRGAPQGPSKKMVGLQGKIASVDSVLGELRKMLEGCLEEQPPPPDIMFETIQNRIDTAEHTRSGLMQNLAHARSEHERSQLHSPHSQQQEGVNISITGSSERAGSSVPTALKLRTLDNLCFYYFQNGELGAAVEYGRAATRMAERHRGEVGPVVLAECLLHLALCTLQLKDGQAESGPGGNNVQEAKDYLDAVCEVLDDAQRTGKVDAEDEEKCAQTLAAAQHNRDIAAKQLGQPVHQEMKAAPPPGARSQGHVRRSSGRR